MENCSIAIDGPAGAGKSTLARALAKEIGYLYVDTGAIYRTVALRCKANEQGIGQGGVVSAQHHGPLRDILPANGPHRVAQTEKWLYNTVQQPVNRFHTHRAILSLTRLIKASRLPFRSRWVVSSCTASSA